MAEKSYTRKELTQHLRQIAAEAHDVDTDGRAITKGEALARLLFKKALGYKEVIAEENRRGEVIEKEVVRKPEPWALQYTWERLEGKIQPAIDIHDENRITTNERVSRMAKDRINAIAQPEKKLDGGET